MIHTYHPELTEPVPPPRINRLPSPPHPSFDNHFINNVQPSTPIKNTFPTPPYSPDNLTFLKNSNSNFPIPMNLSIFNIGQF